jgi:hypothetical protein
MLPKSLPPGHCPTKQTSHSRGSGGHRNRYCGKQEEENEVEVEEVGVDEKMSGRHSSMTSTSTSTPIGRGRKSV